MKKKRECKIQSTVKIICPWCSSIIELPMHKAVNGENILCKHCQKTFQFVL